MSLRMLLAAVGGWLSARTHLRWMFVTVLCLAACGDDSEGTRRDPSRRVPLLPEGAVLDGADDAPDATSDREGTAVGEADAGEDTGDLPVRDAGESEAEPVFDAALDAAPDRGESPRPPEAGSGGGEPGDAAVGFPALDAGAPNEDDDAGPPAPPRLDCMGKSGAPGDTIYMYMGRSFIVHVPANVYRDTAVPVMFVFHGAGSKGADMQAATGFDVLADQLGFVTVYPDGQMGTAPWNVGRNACPPGGFVSTTNDDVSYFKSMLDTIEATQCIARDKVFATGFSMGAYFTHELGCLVGHEGLRAIAPHSGGTHAGDCPGAPIPILILHGDADPLIDYDCGKSARDSWIERNGCSSEVDTLDITGGHCDFHRNCPENGAVVFCTFNGLEHTWGYPPDYEFSTLLIGEFFAPYF